MKEDRTGFVFNFNRNYIAVFLIAVMISVFPGCETYTKKSKSCKNGVCTTVTVKCMAGVCTTTKCRKGNCVVTYSGTQSAMKKKENKEKAAEMANSENREKPAPEIVYKPTVNQKVFIKLLDSFSKAVKQKPGESSAMSENRKSKFDKSIYKKIAFKKLCLRDVEPDCSFMGSGCGIYKAIFFVPLNDSAGCVDDMSNGYHAPEVIKHNVCKREALKYKPGKKYTVSGKVEDYHFYRPDESESSYIEKYFNYCNQLKLDISDNYRCMR